MSETTEPKTSPPTIRQGPDGQLLWWDWMTVEADGMFAILCTGSDMEDADGNLCGD